MRAQGGMGPNVQHEGGEVSEAVREGEEGGMPSYRRILTPTDITNLRAYLQSIGTPSEPKFNDWWEPAPTK
jgi:mono/diheme cytochrome c family protein